MTHIERLVIHGFKSFAKRTELPFTRDFNIVIGPNGSGKCLVGASLVSLSDGSLERIDSIVNSGLDKGGAVPLDDGLMVKGDGRRILCLDMGTLRIVERPIAYYIKRTSPDTLYHIKTRSGRKAVVTPSHPFFILRGSRLASIRADKLVERQRIAVPRSISVPEQSLLFTELLYLIKPEDSLFVPYDVGFFSVLKSAKDKRFETWKSFAVAAGVPFMAVKGLCCKQAVNFSYLVKLLLFAGLSEGGIISLISKVKGKTTGKTCLMPWRNSPEFSRLFGYLLAEGRIAENTARFTNSNKAIVADYAVIFSQVFGIAPSVRKYKDNYCDVLAYSHPAVVILTKLGMGWDTASKSVSNLFLSHSTDEEVGNLLSGLYSGDGYVSGSSIELTTKSPSLAIGVETLLTRLGITYTSGESVKTATNSGFSGSYITIRISGVNNAMRFHAFVPLFHLEKQRRLSQLLLKKGNPNIDVLEVNHLVKLASSELGISVKKFRRLFPRLDAYCYNQCLPTTQGAQQLVQHLFHPLEQDSSSLQALELLAFSDVYWDEIVSIEKRPSEDEWVYDLSVDLHHNFIANNIIVHNSNILDSLCFVLGRLSSRELRTEKLSHLIYNGGKLKQPASRAEVSIFFDNSKKVFPFGEAVVKLSRIIKPSGQSVYRINDKPHTRQQILDVMSLAKINPDGYNVVLQGDITHFVEMSSEERRQVVEDIAGIGVYEEKKKKALAELERVESRVREAEILLAERKTHLKELKKDRDQALKYRELNERVAEDRATYLHLQIGSKSSRKTGFDVEISALNSEISGIKDDIAKLRSAAEEKKKEVQSITEEVESKAEAEQLSLHRAVEQLRVDIATAANRVHMIESELGKVSSRKVQLESDLQDVDSKIASLSARVVELEKEKSSVVGERSRFQSEIVKLRGGSSDVARIEEQLMKVDKNIELLQLELQSSVEKKQQLLRDKDRLEFQIASLDDSMKKVAEIEATNKSELGQLVDKRQAFRRVVLELNRLLSEDSSISAGIGDVKKRLFSANESFTKLRMEHLAFRERAFGSNAVKSLLEQGDIKGIHGTVAQLGSVPAKYSAALEAAAGPRINSLVVDTDLTASKCIKYLKLKKLGRATFLPLNKMRSKSSSIKVSDKGSHGLAIELVSFDSRYKDVFSYVFGDTLVVDDIDVARRIGIGSYRMVGLDGDLAEVSGAMHGGFRQGSSTAFQEGKLGSSLESAEALVAELEASLGVLEKQRAVNEGEISKLRIRKAELEGEIIRDEKSLHLEDSDVDVSRKKREGLAAELKQVSSQLSDADSSVAQLNRKMAELKSGKMKLREQIAGLGNPAAVAELAALEQRVQELDSRIIAADTEISGSKSQANDILAQERERISQIIRQISRDYDSLSGEKGQLVKKSAADRKQLSDAESRAEKFHAKNKALFAKRTKLIEEVQSADERIIRKEEQINTVEVRINNITLKASEVAGELAGLQEEFSRYSGVKLREGVSEEQLKADISRFERMVAEMGNVNMKALEVYEDVETQYNELLGKKDTLSREKDDVVGMMSEIESKKKELFMNTFDALNANFKRAFSELSAKGSEAYLMLESPDNPFNGGVRVRVRIAGDKFMDIRSLSGGEKTMTALAFIFSIQDYEPASFYIFDEVDAALDKKNSEKFAQLIRKYSEKAQYIVISHNDNVITSAGTLYGVSMDEHGISNVVSLKV